MPTSTRDRLLDEINRLLTEGQSLPGTRWRNDRMGDFEVVNAPTFVDLEKFSRWRAGCLNLMRLLGNAAEPWKTVFEPANNRLNHATAMLGTLQAIKDAVERDMLVSIQELVFAEAFADLLEQAEYLLSENYYLAAGVLGRAVLESHLRNWCQHAKCVPSKPKSTMSDFYIALQQGSKINKMEVDHLKSLAAVGNAAAHNESTLNPQDVGRLLRDVRDFLARHPLT